jgi:general secretion pathway protein D
VCALSALLLAAAGGRARAQGDQAPPIIPGAPAVDSVTLRIVNTELRSAVQIMSQYLDRPVIFAGQPGLMVSLETPQPVPKGNVVRLLRGLLESHNYELIADTAGGLYRARPRAVTQTNGAGGPTGAMPGAPRPQGQNNIELFILQLKHARAVEVAQTVNALYGRGTAGGGSGLGATTLSDELRNNLIPPTGGGGGVTPPGAQRSGGLTGELTVVADNRGNNLLVRSNRADFDLIQSLVEKLDVRPLQVLIEVVIAEVQRNSSLGIGMQADLKETTVAGTGSSISGNMGNVGLGDFAMKVMKLGGLDLDASLSLASQRGQLKILSRPIVLTANNHRAEIVVGSQRPFVQVQRALPTDNGARDQVVQYKDVGTKLTVLPTISSDGSVQLEVVQEVSNATAEQAFNAPVISTRSVRTDLLIGDGQTVALGGLTDRESSVTKGGIPLLSDIPILGGLFGRYSRTTNETELFVFLTPHVIRNDADAAKLSAPLQEKAKVKP